MIFICLYCALPNCYWLPDLNVRTNCCTLALTGARAGAQGGPALVRQWHGQHRASECLAVTPCSVGTLGYLCERSTEGVFRWNVKNFCDEILLI